MTIQTSAQWWRLIEHNWDDLALLLRRSGLAHDLDAIEHLKTRRDARIAKRLMAAKRCAPDRRARRQSRSWQILFDLCAEQWVLYQPVA
jgi:hypothetical protein